MFANISSSPLRRDENPDENILQEELDRFGKEIAENNLVINSKKSLIMLCNQSKNYDFPPEFTVGQSKVLEVRDLVERSYIFSLSQEF